MGKSQRAKTQNAVVMLQKKNNYGEEERENFDAFKELSSLLNVPLEEIKDQCCLFQIRNLMGKISKIMVRYNTDDKTLERVLYNVNELSVKGILLSTTYLEDTINLAKKYNHTKTKIISIIDFPFGESLFRSKLSDVRESIRLGVSNVTVVMPCVMFALKNCRKLKRQIKTLGRFKKVKISLALSAMDLAEWQYKALFRLVDKYKLDSVTLIFGDVSFDELKSKMEVVNMFKDKTKINVLANVESVNAVKQLIMLGAQDIMTPYADDIGKKLIEKFNIKGIKLR